MAARSAGRDDRRVSLLKVLRRNGREEERGGQQHGRAGVVAQVLDATLDEHVVMA